jgi:hypothetical protein
MARLAVQMPKVMTKPRAKPKTMAIITSFFINKEQGCRV